PPIEIPSRLQSNAKLHGEFRATARLCYVASSRAAPEALRMHRRLIEAVLIAGLALGMAGSPWAQQPQTKPAPALQYDPSLDANDQLAPSQVTQPMPAAVPTPTVPSHAHATKHAASDAPAAPREARKQPQTATLRAVAC